MHTRPTRRDFLKSVPLTGLAVWVSSGPAALASDSPNERLNIGIIGAGGRGGRNLGAIAATENIVALCDVDDLRLGQAAEKFPRARKYHDFRHMLDALDQQLDAVVVSTPDHTHSVASIAAMKHGKHVYCEKPLARTIHEVRRMTEMAARSGRVTQMGNQRHADPELRRVVELVRGGAIGPIREVLAWSTKSFSGGDRPSETPPVPRHLHWDLWLGPAADRAYHPAYVPFKWRGWWDFGTGNFGDMACHILDAPYWALELGYPTRVEAEGPPVHPESAPQWLIVRYEFPARGERPPVKLTWFDGVKAPPMNEVDGVPLTGQGSLLIGERGKILFPHGSAPARLLPEADFADFKDPAPSLPRTESHYAEWIAACKHGGTPLSNFDYAGPLTETALAGVVAYRVGRSLEWDGKQMQARNAPEADRFIRPEFRTGWSLE